MNFFPYSDLLSRERGQQLDSQACEESTKRQ